MPRGGGPNTGAMVELKTNVAEFNRGLEAAMQAIPEHAEKIYRTAALHVLRGVIDMSPVDTGRFRNNWQVSLGRRVTAEHNHGSAAAAYAAGAARIRRHRRGQTAFVTNNVPYAQALEEGHSKKAPHGVVSITLLRVKQGLVPR